MLKIGEKESSLLELLKYVLDEREFHPFVFAHDVNYDNYEFAKANQLFLELVYFLGNIGINVDSEKTQYDPTINDLLVSITTLEKNFEFWYFSINSIDFSMLNLSGAAAVDYPFVRLFIAFRNGAALDKPSMCRILGRDLSSNDITQLKKVFKRKTSYVFVTNSDNSYSLRKEEE